MFSLAKRLAPMAVLYGGRIGVAALGLVILPWLSKLMPAEQFGLAATILSLQSLAVVVDLGLSMRIASEVPVFDNAHDRRALMRRSERSLFLGHLGVAAIVAVLAAAAVIPLRPSTAILVCLSLLLIVWQNLLTVSLISEQRYLTSTVGQFASLLLRHCCSLILVILMAGTLEAFVIGQVVGAAIVLAASRYAFLRNNKVGHAPSAEIKASPPLNLAMMMYAVAGACAMQLDKVLLSSISSPVSTGPYYLASVLSLVPIAFLATPVSQFVQPKLIACIAREQVNDARRWVGRLTLAILGLAVLPGIALALSAPWLVPLWLHDSPHQDAVVLYTMLMMPGVSIGALGLVPAIVLIARRDYRAMAMISGVLTVVVLSTTALLATRDDISGICVAYAAYHALAAIALWCRARRIEPSFSNLFGTRTRAASDGPEQATGIRS